MQDQRNILKGHTSRRLTERLLVSQNLPPKALYQYALDMHVFYTSAIGMVSTVFSLVGMVIYNRWMQRWSYPHILMVGNILTAACNLLNCVVFSRWNLKLGIDDHIFVLGSDAIQNVCMEIAWLPTMLIISQLCPKGCEATMFALLAGMGNLGSSLGSYFGAYILVMLGVKPTGEPNESAEFDNLWLASVVSSIGPVIPLILPEARKSKA
ncbi:unnamed protein product [Symbiodinium natans]|uniref:Folate/biopterin transporter n=1 Tax=Symbiodinium natans TaxID=878477 RepID=A0A812S5C7_9DINO|nr:unnamed protein product [Symbiodinium natans]